MKAGDLITSLEKDVTAMLEELQALRGSHPLANWQVQPSPDKWSAAQVIEHLNTYNRYYLPEIGKGISKSGKDLSASTAEFTPGWFGAYFTKMMRPTADGRIKNKMKALKNHRPAAALDVKQVLDEFIRKENLLLQLLQDARTVHMGKLRIPISISRFIKLKLGDTFNFLIAHQQRHFLQLNRTLEAVQHPLAINIKKAVG